MLNFINLTKLTSTGLLGILMASSLASQPASANNALTVTIEAPTIQSTLLPGGTYVVDFNTRSGTGGFSQTNAGTIYQYGGDLNVRVKDQWGGASGTKYITQADGKSSFKVQVSQDQKYFGFWWSAGDAANKIIFKNDGQEIAVFETKDLKKFIDSSGVPSTSAYYGNPNCTSTSPTPTPCGTNTGHKAEPFAYVNVFFNNQVYDEVVIQTLTTNGSRFESDNHTFSALNQIVRGINVPQLATAMADLVSTSEDNSTTGNVISNDLGAGLSVTKVNNVATNVGTPITLSSGALLTLNSNGTFTYNPNDRFESLNPNQTATDTFSYTIKDSQNNVSTANVTMTINGAADNPIANNDSFSTDEDNSTTGNVKTNDTDPNGDNLTVSMVNGDAAKVGTPITLTSGALLTLNSNGTFTYNPNKKFESLNDGQTATDSFTYTINDGRGNNSNAGNVTMSISGVTDPSD